MAIRENSANGGSHGVVVTEANSGGASGDAWDQVYVTGSSAVTFYEGPDDGFYSYTVQAAATNDWAACMWLPQDSSPVCAGRMEVFLDAYPPSYWLTLVHLNVSGGDGPTIWVNGAGQLQFSDTIVLDASAENVVPVGSWFRLEWEINTQSPGGYYIINLYADRESTTPTVTLQSTRTWTHAANTLMVWFGQTVNVTGGEGYRFAHPQINDVGMPGPYTGPGPTPPIEPSVNDMFANALPINIASDGGTYQSDPVPLMGNTVEPDEIGDGFESAWWKYVPSSDGAATFDLTGSGAFGDPDTLLHLFNGTELSSLALVASNDDYDSTTQSLLTEQVVGGETYYVRAATFNDYQDLIERSYVLVVTGPAADSGPEPEVGLTRAAPPALVDAEAPAPDVSNLPIVIDVPLVSAQVRQTTPVLLSGLGTIDDLVWRNNANGGVIGETVTPANSVVSGDPFQEVSTFSTGPFYGRPAPGESVAFLLQPNSANQLKWIWLNKDPAPRIGGRAYIYLGPAASSVMVFQITRANGSVIKLFWSQTFKWIFFNEEGGGTPLFGNTVKVDVEDMPTGQWHRVEFGFDFSNPVGSYNVAWFTDAEGTTPAWTMQGARLWTGTTQTIYSGATELWWGPGDGYFDNLLMNGAGTLPGPAVSDQLVAAVPALVEIAAEAPTVTGADVAAPDPVTLDAPAALVDVHALVPVLTGADATVAAPPALVFAGAPAPTVSYVTGVSAPPAAVEVSAPSVSLLEAVITPVYPPSGAVVPSKTPRFRVAVRTEDAEARVEVQYANTGAFTDSVIISSEIPYGLTTTNVVLRAGAPLIDNVAYVWRARVVNAFDATAWTTPLPFTISVIDGEALAGGTWTLDPGHVADPFLWWTVPDRGRPGDLVVAVGTSFGPHTATVTISGVLAPGDLYGVAPGDEAYTPDRRISRDDDDVDPGHTRVDFTVPLVGPPAGPLYVDGT